MDPTFRRRLRGYDVASVDAFVQVVAAAQRETEADAQRWASEVVADWQVRAAAWDEQRNTLRTELAETTAALEHATNELERLRARRGQTERLIDITSEAIARAEKDAAARAARVVADAEAQAERIVAEAQQRINAVLVEFECIDSVRSHASERLDDVTRILTTAGSMLESIPLPGREHNDGATVLDVRPLRDVI